ncbi:hypothetical protein A2V49_04355 [candidate division WWE3 bacterium RBG_19FT_COMBO_34_6]|uniref:Uncharacterized protein n=1 Tax=candidate division WWE3 bacterium RBG_19FT_COMBO_34_6 TaxID=1802612 RepID=A0A1F4UKX6_UNCKA|nr:MAG: hypothetical protein A2V49_04355 [candidate division WWE3 bacterium RBG_19FT_COMBO_34_6]
MKKLTNWELCQEIVVYGQAINRMIEDIELIKSEAAKLEMSDGLRETINKVINQYNNQLTEIVAANWINFSNSGVKHLFKTFRKGYLLNFQDRMKDDLTVLSEYQDELLKAMDYIHKVQSKAAAINKEMTESKKDKENENFDLYDNNNNWIDGGDFKNIYKAINGIESYGLKDGNYYITGDTYKADFEIIKSEIDGLKFSVLKGDC